MKRILALALAAVMAALALSSCRPRVPEDATTDYIAVKAIDHCAVEPDEAAAMDEEEEKLFRRMMDAMLSAEAEMTLPDDGERVAFCLELLKESPYFFFVKDMQTDGGTLTLSYVYSPAEQQEILSFMDGEFLKLCNAYAAEDDNELDIVLKCYRAVTQYLTYDSRREDNKQPESPLFRYPADEIYKAMRSGKCLCFGFAYLLNFVLLQRGAECFKVRGYCRAHEEGHMWNAFRYDGSYFNCDPTWDRSSDGCSKLYHFGKTDQERLNDSCEAFPFVDYHEEAYAPFVCDDARFRIFRGVIRFDCIGDHRYVLETNKGKEKIFDSETFTVSK